LSEIYALLNDLFCFYLKVEKQGNPAFFVFFLKGGNYKKEGNQLFAKSLLYSSTRIESTSREQHVVLHQITRKP